MVSTLFEQSHGLGLDEESRLVDRAVTGDESSFVTLYHRYYNKVYSIAKGILLYAEEAEDVTQEIFTLAYRNLSRFDRRSKFSTWLFRIAVNRSIQESRKNKGRRNNVPLGDEVNDVAESTVVENHDPQVSEAMAKLLPPDRAILTLFYWDELSLQEVGESLGCSANAAKTRLFRARERFRDVYEGIEQ